MKEDYNPWAAPGAAPYSDIHEAIASMLQHLIKQHENLNTYIHTLPLPTGRDWINIPFFERILDANERAQAMVKTAAQERVPTTRSLRKLGAQLASIAPETGSARRVIVDAMQACGNTVLEATMSEAYSAALNPDSKRGKLSRLFGNGSTPAR